MKVLFVEDEKVLLDLYLIEFEAVFPQIQCCGAADGIEALKILEKEEINLIITDGRMPNMDGVELAEAVKKHYSNIPIILITGQIENLEVIKLNGLFLKVFNKPVDLDRFFEELSTLLPIQAQI